MSPPHLLTYPQEHIEEKQQSWDVKAEPLPDLKFCFFPFTQLTCTQIVRRRRTHSTKTRFGGSQVYHLGGKLSSTMENFKVKFGAEGRSAQIPGRLVAMESQLRRKEESKPISRHCMPSPRSRWRMTCMQSLNTEILKYCDAPQINSHCQAPIPTPTHAPSCPGCLSASPEIPWNAPRFCN